MTRILLVSCALLLAAGAASAQQRFVIEREIPGASQMTPEQRRDAAKTSNSVLRDLGPEVEAEIPGGRRGVRLAQEVPEVVADPGGERPRSRGVGRRE